ncbi:odorant receptor Or1-like [Halictus rubicundus]|uniref:odorant receptor Or1-like n=1 Tax=Halictus rubicundus TaxID=77578 RepID=UPI0040367992
MTTTTFRYTFLTFTVLGCLPPATWTSTAKRRLYNVYTFLVLILVQTTMLTSVLDIVFNVKNPSEFSDNFYLTVSIIISIYKMLNFMGKRDDILFLIDKVKREPFTPVNEAERIIKMKFDKEIQSRIVYYGGKFVETALVHEKKNTSLVFLFVISLYLSIVWGSSVVRDLKVRSLGNPRVWVPYDYSRQALYKVTYCHQASTLIALTFVHFANDTLISGLMILIRGQLTLLQHRLQNIMGDPNLSVKACAKHHADIYQLAADVNKYFQGIMGFQFAVSTSMACFTLFRITRLNVGIQMYESAVYIVCTLMQLSYYCWYGNEVKLKSLEVPAMIFASNWPDFDNNSKKMLMIIMKRATSPIEFSSGHVVSLNLDAFMAVLKTSYSIFNVLHTT